MSELLVELSCHQCGAAGHFVGDHLIAVCDYCSAIIATHRAVIATVDNIALAETRGFVAPTLADVRRLELHDLKYEALERRDGETMRAATIELAVLDAVEAGAALPVAATWGRWTAAIEHVATFGDTAVPVHGPSPSELAADPRDAVDRAYRGYLASYRQLMADRLFPIELARAIAPETAAMDTLFGVLRGLVMSTSFDALDQALIALGQRPVTAGGAPLPCRTCGAPLSAAALAATVCEYCRAAIELRRHLWLDGMLRAVAVANANTVKPDDRAWGAIAMVMSNTRIAGRPPPDRWLAAFVGGLDGIARPEMERMLAFVLAHHEPPPTERALLIAVEHHIDQLPAAIPRVVGHRAGHLVMLEPNEAWVRALRRNWRRMVRYSSLAADELALATVNLLLAPLAGGYLPPASDAIAFLRTTEIAIAALRAALALHRDSEADPVTANLWQAVSDGLG